MGDEVKCPQCGKMVSDSSPAPPDINTLSDSSRGVESAPLPLDLTKPVRTRDGKKVRVLCTDKVGAYPVVGIIDPDTDGNFVATWTARGQYENDCRGNFNLVQDVPPPAEGECFVYGDYHHGKWTTCSVPVDCHWAPHGCCRIRVRLVEGKFDE